jgi:hypothetical protein
MKIEIRQTKEDGIIQITTLDERWYEKDGKFNPSVTWIGHYSPMGIGLLKHYADKGWDEAEAVKKEAAEHGSKQHQACEALLAGQTITLDLGFAKPDTGDHEELTPDEYYGVMTFADFWTDLNKNHTVQLIDTEKVVWVDPDKGEQYGYAGTRDMKLTVDGKPTIIDLKTSKDIYLSHELQLSALKHADPDLPDIFVLQIGYKRNKAGWKLTPIEDKFPLFLAAKKFWSDANPDSKPKEKDYPPEIKLTISKEPIKAETKSITKSNGKGKGNSGKASRPSEAKARN